jgi:hypothetical protein
VGFPCLDTSSAKPRALHCTHTWGCYLNGSIAAGGLYIINVMNFVDELMKLVDEFSPELMIIDDTVDDIKSQKTPISRHSWRI